MGLVQSLGWTWNVRATGNTVTRTAQGLATTSVSNSIGGRDPCGASYPQASGTAGYSDLAWTCPDGVTVRRTRSASTSSPATVNQ